MGWSKTLPLFIISMAVGLFLTGCTGPRGAEDEPVARVDLPGVPNGDQPEIPAEVDQAIAALDAEVGKAPPEENPIPRVRSGLVLDVEVYVQGIPEIQEKGKRIAPSGQVTLPVIGSLQAAGCTLEELEANLTKAYEVYMLEPQVIVSYSTEDQWITASPWGFVTVMGRVRSPGRVPLPPTRDLTVSVAIQMAGGFDTSADKNDIIVSRMLADGKREKKKVSLSDLAKKGRFEEDIVLYDRDVIFVPEHLF